MTMRRAVVRLLIAALLTVVIGPGLAEARSQSQKSGDSYVLKKQSAKKAKRQHSGKHCNRVVPPFMRNPRYMNRGFFKCRSRD